MVRSRLQVLYDELKASPSDDQTLTLMDTVLATFRSVQGRTEEGSAEIAELSMEYAISDKEAISISALKGLANFVADVDENRKLISENETFLEKIISRAMTAENLTHLTILSILFFNLTNGYDPALQALIRTKKLPELLEMLFLASFADSDFPMCAYLETFQRLVQSDKASVKEYPSNTLLELAKVSNVWRDDTDVLDLAGQLMLAFKSQDDRFDKFLTADKKTAASYGQICFDVIEVTSDSKEEDIINTRKAFATLFANLSVIPEFADSIQFSDNDEVFQLLYRTATSPDTASSAKGIAYLMIGNFAYTEQQARSLVSAFPDIISYVVQFLRTEKLSEDNLQSLQLVQNLLKNSIVDEFVKRSDGFLEVLERVLTQQFYPLFKSQAVAITGTILGNLGEDDADKINFLICQALAGVYQKEDNFEVKSKIIGAISRVSSVIAQNLPTKGGFADSAAKSIELAFDYSYSTSQKPNDQWDLFNLLKALKTLGVLSGNNAQSQPAILEYIESNSYGERSERIAYLLSTFSNQLTEYQRTLSESADEEERGKGALVKGSVMNLAYLASKIQSNQGEKYSSEIIDACQTAINNSALLATPTEH